MKTILYIACIGILATSCRPQVNEPANSNRYFAYDSAVRSAWRRNDTIAFRQNMYALRDTSLSDGEFLDRLRIITSVTNFYAGHFEVCDTCWINVQPGPVKRHYKYVVADLYAAYANSKFLFDSTFDYKWSLNAQRQYFDSTLQGKISAGEYIKRMEEDARIGRGESTIDG